MSEFVNRDSIEILDGVYLTRSTASPVWQAYFRVDGRTYRKTTKKRDFDQAKMVALELFYNARRTGDLVQATKAIPFTKLADVYESYVAKRMRSRYHVDTMKRHLLPYFCDVKDIAKIDQGAVTRYVDWRTSKSEKVPTRGCPSPC